MTSRLREPVFVVFEGLDGSGKTTIARLLAERIEAVLLTTPSPDVRVYRDDLIRGYGGCQEACQLFYLSTVFDVSARARELIRHGQSVVVDRYFLSTQAYAAFRGSGLDIDGVESLLLPADLTVFLDPPFSVRYDRLAARGATAADRETMAVDSDRALRREHMERAELAVVGYFLRLDAVDAGPDDLTERVLRVLRLP